MSIRNCPAVQAIVGPNGRVDPNWERWFGDLAREVNNTSTSEAAPTPEYPEFTINGAGSITAEGAVAAGEFVVTLEGDNDHPLPNSFYGTDDAGNKGFVPVSQSLTAGTGIAITNSGYTIVDTVSTPEDLPLTGNAGEAVFVTDAEPGIYAWDGSAFTLDAAATGEVGIALAALADAGTGTALKKILRDAYGRVSATEDAALADVSDVDAAAPSNGNTLLFDSATQKWKAQPLPAGLGWTALGSFDQAVDGTIASKDFTDLDGYQEFMVLGRGITTSVSTDIVVRVSVDNGTSFYSASTDYALLNSSSVEGVSSVLCTTGAATSSAKSPSLIIQGNIAGEYPLGRSASAGQDRRFIASSAGINALRVGASSGNMTAGKFTLYGR